jgi:superfamily II DNA/RNA helicase
MNPWQTLSSLIIPDPWQQEAIHILQQGHDLILSAPTGAGKTLIFEKIIEAHKFHKRAFYTVPTRALANDKYLEWKARQWPVGIMTGDISIHTEAPVIVATLEAALSLATGKLQADLLVIDEYQWISDEYRGHHYEGMIMQAPPNMQLLLMSGSVGNLQDIATWLRRLRRSVEIIQHDTRPVPLDEIDAEALAITIPKEIEGFWPRIVAAALKEDLGPLLIFLPHRKEAEKLARQLATRLPPAPPLELTQEQNALLSDDLRLLLKARIACHHSGLSYAQRAGVIEPLAKVGQLRVVVATLGLSSGINFSLRSVLIPQLSYKVDGLDREIPPHALLQMMGRAGRRGLDERGYVLSTRQSAKISQARLQHLRRSRLLPWSILLHQVFEKNQIQPSRVEETARALFTTTPPLFGIEHLKGRGRESFPCAQLTDTGRARLVRRKFRKFSGCKSCLYRSECESLSSEPTPIWQWQRLGLIDFDLRLTLRGQIARSFIGPEGLAVAAALEQEDYPIDHLIIDCANLFAAERFCGQENRWSGRLSAACQHTYGHMSIEGYLHWGVPWQYGCGGAECIEEMLTGRKMTGTYRNEYLGRGDIDRLFTEWHSFLRQIRSAPDLESPRWLSLKQWAADYLKSRDAKPFISLPPLTPSQKQVVSHLWRRIKS